MDVELALFDGDKLLEREMIRINPEMTSNAFNLFSVRHQLHAESAKLILDNFAEAIALNRTELDMPIHESDDWETIDLGGYTLAFWCRVNA